MITEAISKAVELSGVQKVHRVALKDHEKYVWNNCEKYKIYLQSIDAGLYVMISEEVRRAYVSTCAETYLGTELISVLFVFVTVLNEELKREGAL